MSFVNNLKQPTEKRTKSIPVFNQGELNRFWSTIAITANDNKCWEWTGYNLKGYGIIPIKVGEPKYFLPFRATRVSYFINKGIDPVGKLVCHTCDNPKCVNPKHLFLGTSKDNTTDMFAKNRANPPRGDSHWGAKLTEEKVREIKKLISEGYLYTSIAEKYNIYSSVVSRINSGKAWKHVL